MKIFVLLGGLLLGVSNVALAQSNASSGHPSYFGTGAANGAASPAATKAVEPARQDGATIADKQPAAVPDAKAQAEEARMKKVAPLIKSAREKILTTKASYSKQAPLSLAEAALNALKTTDGGGRYHGHRAKAIESLKNAIEELKTGDRANKADGYLGEGADEVSACEGLAR